MANIILLGKMIKETSLFSLETSENNGKINTTRKANNGFKWKAIEIGMNY